MLTEKLKHLLTNSLTLNQIKEIHAFVKTIGINQLESLLLRQTLLSTNIRYSGDISWYVQQALCFFRNTDSATWSFAVRFFSTNGQFETAFHVHVLMQRQGLCPRTFAFSSSLKACAKLGHKLGGFSVHSQVHKLGFSSSVYVLTSLLDFYCKTGDMESARKVFDKMPERNVVSWNAMLSGYLRSGNLEEAQRVFDETPMKDVVSWNSMITGYARAKDMGRAMLLFKRMPERNLASWNAMISGYSSFSDMESAQSVFDSMPARNIISWITLISGYSKRGDVVSARWVFDKMGDRELLAHNAMIACYEKNSQPKEALELFNQMLNPETNIQPDKMTLTSVLSACSQLGYLEFGLWIKSYMKKHGIQMDNHLANAFIDLYAKNGNVDMAHELFRGLRNKDLVSYSAMISGFGINGMAFDAVNLFNEMVKANISPNLITYKGLLTAYNHAGLVEEGYNCFNSMKERGLEASADHYGIVVDLLGRSGRLEEAHELIKGMLVKPHGGVWGALLLACKLHGNVELGEIAARKCLELQPQKTGHPSLLANIYASVGRWDDAGRLRNDVAAKTPGCSWMESN